MTKLFKTLNRKIMIAGALLISICLPVETSAAESTIQIGSRLELFVDRHLVDEMESVEFRLHHPQKLPLPKSPLLGDYATVIKDGDLYRGYYRDVDPSYTGKRYSGDPGEITCYAESRDGHEWTFPTLGLFEVNGSRENNAILAKKPPFLPQLFAVLGYTTGPCPERTFQGIGRTSGLRPKSQGRGPSCLRIRGWPRLEESRR